MLPLDQQVDKLKSALGDQAFSGGDVARVLGIDPRGTGGIFKYMTGRGIVRRIKSGTYQFANAQKQQTAPVEALVKVESAPVDPVITEHVCSTPPLMRIGDYLLFHERVILIADMARQEGSDAIRLTTSILEYDTTFRAVRNKVINLLKSRDPREYAAMRAWLDSMAGTPPHVVDDTALELAAELEKQLNAANREIAELRERIKKIQAVFAEATV